MSGHGKVERLLVEELAVGVNRRPKHLLSRQVGLQVAQLRRHGRDLTGRGSRCRPRRLQLLLRLLLLLRTHMPGQA